MPAETLTNGAAGQEKKPKWYFTTSFLVVSLLSVGPLALPLLWFNPRRSLQSKILVSVVTAVLTWALVTFAVDTGKKVLEQYRELGLIQ